MRNSHAEEPDTPIVSLERRESAADEPLQPAPFIARVAAETGAYFARQNRPIKSRARSRLAQFWWGSDAAVHYEVWIRDRYLQLELGLHFEASAERNSALYRGLGRYMLDIHQALGDSLWLEEWDRGWTRLYETYPLNPLDEGRVYTVASRLCEVIEAVQPIYEHVNSGL